MGQIKLSSAEISLLGAVELDADRTFVQLAKELHRRPSALQRSFKLLVERGVVVGKTAVIDTSKLGVLEYGFYLELGARTKKQREEFLQYLKSTPGVSWIAEVGGGYDLTLNILARHPLQVQNLFAECYAKFPRLIVRKHMVQRTARMRCYRGYLGGRSGVRFRLGTSPDGAFLSAEELRVIVALDGLRFQSYRDLAAQRHISVATFTRIVRRLQERKILCGFGYRLNTDVLGMQQFRVLLNFTSLTEAVVRDLESFVAKIRGVKLLLRCLGEWDYEMEVDVPSSRGARDISALLWERYGESLSHVDFIPVFEHLKFISFGTVAKV